MSVRTLLLDAVHENHFLYEMEKRDRPNNAIRLLVSLHELQATSEQLTSAYQEALRDLQPIRGSESGRVNQDNWQDFLGVTEFYKDYLLFYDDELSRLGLEKTLETYFYPIQTSIGSQLQPIVHLAFGIENGLSEVITQALAYYSSSFIDASSIVDLPTSENNNNVFSTMNTAADTLIFDMIGSDQRFDGKIEGNNTFHSAVKLLLKSKFDLLKTYMIEWSKLSMTPTQRLDALLLTAAKLIKYASREDGTHHTDLDWFLAGGQLIESALAIKKLIRPEHLEHWCNLQFLSTLCTFIVQGRPITTAATATSAHTIMAPLTWEKCIALILESSDPKAILAIVSLLKAYRVNPSLEPLYLENATILAQFVQDGTWVKAGLGWSN
ncbi:hypothetical protein K501DRAFT_214813 [Backusella circina FSU 941]|nr:hypothetical protein K501DRAFT_214813 [Backusella circina FSU 941]